MNIEDIRNKPAANLTGADRAALVAHGFTIPGFRGISVPILTKLRADRVAWQAALVAVRVCKGLDPRACDRLKIAEREYITSFEAATRWTPPIAVRPPRFKPMPKIDPYAVRDAYAA